jgi:hypothetical protein
MGKIELLADRWFCKETKQTCPVDAVISRIDLETSLVRCNASRAAKATVRGAASAGYRGLHHTSGKYVCPGCRNRDGYRPLSLRYRFELQTLGDIFDLARPEVRNLIRRQMAMNDVNAQALFCGLCARCLYNTIEKINPSVVPELHVLHFDVAL